MSKKKPDNLMALESAPERAREAIREMINSGEIEPGQRIDQRDLAKKLELTTVPIREALCWLEAEGLVKRVPGCGVFCKTYTVDEIQELLEVRGALEALAAGLAAENCSTRQKNELLALVDRMNAVPKDDQEKFLKMHVDFHRSIVEMSDNESLMNIWGFTHITEQVLVRLASHLWPSQPHDHTDIANIIAGGDRAEAERVMREHIMPTYEERLRLLRDEYGTEPIL
ncbi:GntR family transcriptional regulator [Tichowtungia aerotolerans]|uniref:FCD domain-containing protein n=1 Tax=Tichowtungia aerotolerans TaxID=2697043 RepID=A0A6P1M4X0_9BACT|nr:GntR family transcriptional regulator [Tichowtungia aerotolerans]QHI69839.1 FCD domain-containing protein [Tichowtungia aerotolerans]